MKIAAISIFLISLTCATGVLHAASEMTASAKFEKALSTLTQADDARDHHKLNDAVRLYREALDIYMGLSREYPNWQPGVVEFRIEYSNKQLESLMKKLDRQFIPKQAPTIETKHKNVADPHLGGIPSRAKKLLSEGKTDEARKVLMRGLTINPDDKTIRLLIAITQCQSKRFDDAVFILDQLIKEDPHNANAFITLSTAYFALGKTKQAITEAEHALRLDPNIADAHYNLAYYYLSSNPPNKAKARSHYRLSIELGGLQDKKLENKL